jgi:tripartite-type tricarboxylate transporter receptor subunit TctC
MTTAGHTLTRIIRALAACAALALAPSGHAQTPYPSKPVRLLIPFPPGGPTDAAVRVLLPALSQALGQPFSIENMAGSHGALAPTALLKAPPDGHTLLVGNSSPLVAVPILRRDAPYDPVKDFAPVSLLGWTPLLLVVTPDLPVKSLADLIRHARQNPGRLTVAAANPPTIFTLAQLSTRERLDIASRAYPIDAAAMNALLNGEAQIMAAGLTGALEHIRAGRLRAIATLGAARARLAPDVPTMAEAGVGDFAILPWVAMFAPGGTPPGIVGRLAREVAAALQRPDVREGLHRAAFEPRSSTPEELGAFLQDQLKVWGAVAREAGLSAH